MFTRLKIGGATVLSHHHPRGC